MKRGEKRAIEEGRLEGVGKGKKKETERGWRAKEIKARERERADGVREEDKSSQVHSVANKSCTGAPRLPRLLRVTFLRKIGPVEVL